MNFHAEALNFLKELMSVLEKAQVKIESHWDIDHLCYRVSSQEKYETLKKEFLGFSKLLIESEVNGRMIATFKIHQPVRFQSWVIDTVELPAPKKGKTTIEGFEHVEVVSDLTFAEIEQRFAHVKLDRGGLNKTFNQELELCLGEINLKFHPLSLESVINLEKNEKVHSALEKSSVLKNLRKYNPLIAGTFPLDLATSGSDLDVLVEVQDHEAFAKEAKSYFGQFQDFDVQTKLFDGVNTTIVRFKVDDVPFEIFGQNVSPVKQKAYRHFLVEERLLKVKGQAFKEEIQNLRARRIKTEPAFAQALNIQGDGYVELLQFEKLEIVALANS